MQSVELRIANFVNLAKNNGKTAEAKAIMESASGGEQLERKCAELESLTKNFVESFQESAGKNLLVESYKRNLGFTEAEARVAAGLDCVRRNDGFSWDLIRDMKDRG